MTNLEKKLCELLQELHKKREDYEALQQRYNSELLLKEELKGEIETLKTEGRNLTTHLEMTNKALHKCEENYSVCRDSAVKHKLGLDASARSLELTKEQATKLHMENVKLKKQVEDLERDMKTESFYRESCDAKQKKLQATIDALSTQMRSVEKESREVERQAKEAISVGEKSKQVVALKESAISELRNQTQQLTSEIITLTSENRNLQESLKEKKVPEEHYVKEILQEWQTSMNEMKMRTVEYEKESEALHKTLQDALTAQCKLKNLEEAASHRAKELELKIVKMQKTDERNRTDCSVQTDLNISIDVSCQTIDVSVETSSLGIQVNLGSLQDTTTSPVHKKSAEEEVSMISSDIVGHPDIPSVPKKPLIPVSSYTSASLQELMAKYQLSLEPRSLEIPDKQIPPSPGPTGDNICLNDVVTQINPNLPRD